MTNKVFSFDAETNGLWGQAFQIAAVVYNDEEVLTHEFNARCPIDGPVNNWISTEVLPAIEYLEMTHDSYDLMLKDFSEFYLTHKRDADVIVHMGYIVESKILRDMYEKGFIGEFDGPYPLIDIAGNLKQNGWDPTSVDKYVLDNNLDVPKGTSHDALQDCKIAACVYNHIMYQKNQNI